MRFKKYLVALLCVAAMGVTAPSLVQAGDNLDVQTEIVSTEDTVLQTEFEGVEISADRRRVYFDGDYENPASVSFEGGEGVLITLIDPERGIEIRFNREGYAAVGELSETTLRQFGFSENEAGLFTYDSGWRDVTIPALPPTGNNGVQIGSEFASTVHGFVNASVRNTGGRTVFASLTSNINGLIGWANIPQGLSASFNVAGLNSHRFVARVTAGTAPAIPNAQAVVWTTLMPPPPGSFM